MHQEQAGFYIATVKLLVPQCIGLADDEAETAAKRKKNSLRVETESTKKKCNTAHIIQAENKSKALQQGINYESKLKLNYR